MSSKIKLYIYPAVMFLSLTAVGTASEQCITEEGRSYTNSSGKVIKDKELPPSKRKKYQKVVLGDNISERENDNGFLTIQSDSDNFEELKRSTLNQNVSQYKFGEFTDSDKEDCDYIETKQYLKTKDSEDSFESDEGSDYEKLSRRAKKSKPSLSKKLTDQIIKTYNKNNKQTFQEIGVILRVSPTKVSKALKAAGLIESKEKKRILSNENIEQIRTLYLQDYSPVEISELLDVPLKNVRVHCRLAGFKNRELTPEDRQKAIKYKEEGETNDWVAKELDCHPFQIQKLFSEYKRKLKK